MRYFTLASPRQSTNNSMTAPQSYSLFFKLLDTRLEFWGPVFKYWHVFSVCPWAVSFTSQNIRGFLKGLKVLFAGTLPSPVCQVLWQTTNSIMRERRNKGNWPMHKDEHKAKKGNSCWTGFKLCLLTKDNLCEQRFIPQWASPRLLLAMEDGTPGSLKPLISWNWVSHCCYHDSVYNSSRNFQSQLYDHTLPACLLTICKL